MVRAQQEAKRPKEAERLLRDFAAAIGKDAPPDTTAIIVHSPTAMALSGTTVQWCRGGKRPRMY